MSVPDAIVVGSGPNGLAAAVTLARAGVSVLVLEAQATIGGGVRSAPLTLPGFTHDVCSAIHPFAYASPFFRTLPLEQFGLSWIHAAAPLAHPFDGGSSFVLERSLDDTCAGLGEDGRAYAALMKTARKTWDALLMQRSARRALPYLVTAAPTAMKALRSISNFARRTFHSPTTRALFAGAAAHSMLPLEKAGTTAIALGLLTAAHAGGWPFPRGGAQNIADSLAAYLRSLGGRIQTSERVRDLRALLRHRAILLDITPRQLLAIAEPLLPHHYARALRRFRYGIAAFKADWALSDPVPWRSAEVRRAVTLHIGGSLEEIAAAERAPWAGTVSDHPFIIAAQHSLFDATRAPAGKHTLWAYCHVPFGSDIDMLDRVEAQIERFAPGFRDCILARSAMPPLVLEASNENLVGGDITGGMQDLWQTFIRPTRLYWKTPLHNVYLCSSSTPPGVGVHGMCGHLAARLCLHRNFGIRYSAVRTE